MMILEGFRNQKSLILVLKSLFPTLLTDPEYNFKPDFI